MKKIIAVNFMFLVITVFAQNAFDFEIIQNENGTLTISGYNGSKTDIVIPKYISKIKVVAIGNGAFANKNITSVKFSDSIIVIGEYAFLQNKLTTLELPESIIYVGDGAFAGNQIHNLDLPDSLEYIGTAVFLLNKIETVIWPLNVEIIKKGTFVDNPVKAVSFGGATLVEEEAFKNTNITVIRIGFDVSIHRNSGIDTSFINIYNGNGRKSGGYAIRERLWQKVQ